MFRQRITVFVLALALLSASRVSFAQQIWSGYDLGNVNTNSINVAFSDVLKDETGKVIKSPVLVEFLYLLNPQQKIATAEALQKKIIQADDVAVKNQLTKDLDELLKKRYVSLSSMTIKPGEKKDQFIPHGQYEVRFTVINEGLPGNVRRKPFTQRIGFNGFGSLNVEVSPEGGFVGGTVTIDELLKKIEDLEKKSVDLEKKNAELLDRVTKLEKK